MPNPVISKKVGYILLLLLFFADLSYSFVQHANQPLDGDLPWILAPSEDLLPVLENPLGLQTLLNDSSYLNPNRYFGHASLRAYMGSAPIAIQSIADPIPSVYLATALAKTLIQLSLILLLATMINGGFHLRKTKFWMIAVLITPFFQANGYQAYMGIIDPSITYTFFYALPILGLLLYLLPVFFLLYYDRQLDFHPIVRIAHFLLLPIICLSGPLNSGISLVLIAVTFLALLFSGQNKSANQTLIGSLFQRMRSIPAQIYGYLIPLAVFSIYSLYIGTYDSFTRSSRITLSEIYADLPSGIWNLVSTKLGLPLLILALVFNAVIIRYYFPGRVSRIIRSSLLWVGIFVLLYILLLPFGGYRSYRPSTLRFDTFLPVTICLIFLYTSTSIFLLERLSSKKKAGYLLVLIAVAAIFTFADRPELNTNNCEAAAFAEIAASPLDIVALGNDCSVMDWRLSHDPEHSRLRGQALYQWGITEKEKLYFNTP